MENKNEFKFDPITLNFSLEGCRPDNEYLIELEFLEKEKDAINKFETEKKKCISNNLIIEFSNSLSCKYYFYKIQYIKINIKRQKNSYNFKNIKFNPNSKFSLSTIINSKNYIFRSPINKNDNEEILVIKAENPNKKNYSFTDYIKAGISFNAYIGIDFSNKKEHITPLNKNQYIKSIAGLRETIFEFVKIFEVYGYGVNILNPEINNSGFFNFSLNENPNLKGLTEISNAYENCLNNIIFSENKNILSPLLNHIKNRIYQKYELIKYNILFLLISQSPKKEDYQKCINAFIENSLAPLSIIIIGIGDNEKEFKNIKDLCNNNNHSFGMKKERNNIFFITMKECNFDENILKNICLKEIPNQMVEFYRIINTTPENIIKQNFDNIKKSLNLLDSNNSIIQQNDDYNSAPSIASSINNSNIDDSLQFLGKNYIDNNTNTNKNEKKDNDYMMVYNINDNNIIEKDINIVQKEKNYSTPGNKNLYEDKNINLLNPQRIIIKKSCNKNFLKENIRISNNENNMSKSESQKNIINNLLNEKYQNSQNNMEYNLLSIFKPYPSSQNIFNFNNNNPIPDLVSNNREEEINNPYINNNKDIPESEKTPLPLDGPSMMTKYNYNKNNVNPYYNNSNNNKRPFLPPNETIISKKKNNNMNMINKNNIQQKNIEYNIQDNYNSQNSNYQIKGNISQKDSCNPNSKDSTLNSIKFVFKDSTSFDNDSNVLDSQLKFTSKNNIIQEE